jgi:hypothetical protein
MKTVRITKINQVTDPACITPNFNDYTPGVDNGHVSLPNKYTIEGTLIEDIQLNKPVVVSRTSRNGVKSFGLFQTSPVTEITENGFNTLNSIYVLEVI